MAFDVAFAAYTLLSLLLLLLLPPLLPLLLLRRHDTSLHQESRNADKNSNRVAAVQMALREQPRSPARSAFVEPCIEAGKISSSTGRRCGSIAAASAGEIRRNKGRIAQSLL